MKIYILDKNGEHFGMLLDTEKMTMKFIDHFEEQMVVNSTEKNHILRLSYGAQCGIFRAHKSIGYRLEME